MSRIEELEQRIRSLETQLADKTAEAIDQGSILAAMVTAIRRIVASLPPGDERERIGLDSLRLVGVQNRKQAEEGYGIEVRSRSEIERILAEIAVANDQNNHAEPMQNIARQVHPLLALAGARDIVSVRYSMPDQSLYLLTISRLNSGGSESGFPDTTRPV